ncbi:hypothetical protein BGZ54_000603 [Gamsiella multidivaricata]|nr:hypothetical protein BGZ54_000603 [Gamsiella multidivaricata]
MISSEGPLPAIVEIATEMMDREQYKETFQQLKENGFVDQDDSEGSDNNMWGDDDKSNLDYEDPKSVVSDQETQLVEIPLRNRTVEKEAPIEGFSSVPSSPYADEVYSQTSPCLPPLTYRKPITIFC